MLKYLSTSIQPPWHARAYHARMILKKGWISDFEILEICGHVSCEVYEQGLPTRIETQNTENRNNTSRSTTKSMLTQENKINMKMIKKIMIEIPKKPKMEKVQEKPKMSVE